VDRTLPAGARHDLTDEQWTILEPIVALLLPPAVKPGRPRHWPLRTLINGVRFRTRTGCPWRDVAERYGTWQCVYGLFRDWQLAGRWAAIVTELQAAGAQAGAIEWVVSVDSTVNRAHQRTPPVGEPTRPRPGPVPRWAVDQGAPGHRAGPQAAGHGAHRGPGRRQSAVHGGAGPDPGAAPPRHWSASTRSATDPPGTGARRPRVLQPRQPGLPALPRHPRDHPGQGRPAGQPTEPGLRRWPPTSVRQDRLPAAAHRRDGQAAVLS
jgi:transposase